MKKFQLDLQWPSFNIDINTVETWMKINAGSNYIGNSADLDLTLWFNQDPGDSIKNTIQSYWSSLTTSSIETINYQSYSKRKATLLYSATAKLKALGLSDEEISAILK